jgi:hypothetical protein
MKKIDILMLLCIVVIGYSAMLINDVLTEYGNLTGKYMKDNGLPDNTYEAYEEHQKINNFTAYLEMKSIDTHMKDNFMYPIVLFMASCLTLLYLAVQRMLE